MIVQFRHIANASAAVSECLERCSCVMEAFLRTALVVFLLLSTTVSKAFSAASEPETVRIGVCLSLTGELSEFGGIYLCGLNIRLAEFNTHSQESGYRIELLNRDDESDPGRAAAITKEFIDTDDVVAIIGSNSTDVTMAMVDLTRKHGIALVTPSSTNPQFGYPGDTVFRVLFDDDFQGATLARHTIGKLGLKRAALIVNNRFTYSRSIAKAFRAAFEKEGGEIVAEEVFDCTVDDSHDFDFVPLLSRIQKASPDVILLPSYAPEASAIIRQSLPLGMKALFCGSDAWHADAMLYESGNGLENGYYTGIMDDRVETLEMRAFMDMLDNSNDKHAEMASALGYDALSILIKAMETGRSRREIVEGMYRIKDFPLTTGHITIDRNRGIIKPAYIVTIVKNNYDFIRKTTNVVIP